MAGWEKGRNRELRRPSSRQFPPFFHVRAFSIQLTPLTWSLEQASIAYACVLFGREEFEADYQDKLAEYEAELKEWKKEAKRRVTV